MEAYERKDAKARDDETDRMWELLKRRQGEIFYTAKKLPFTYTVRGGELFVDRRSKSITRATFDRAMEKLLRDEAHEITGPKALYLALLQEKERTP